MSAIQPMDVATPHSALQVPVSTASSDAESGHPFAEVMRSAVSCSTDDTDSTEILQPFQSISFIAPTIQSLEH